MIKGNFKRGDLRLNDYYAEKYNLDEYSKKSEPRERAPKSGSRSRANSPKSARRTDSRSKSTQNKNPKNKPPQKKSKRVAFALVAVVAVAGIGALAFLIGSNMYRNYRKGLPFHYSQRVTVGGIDIGGLTAKEAKAKLRSESITAVEDISLTVNANGKAKEFTKEDFTYKFDYKTPLSEAKEYSLREQGLYEAPEGALEEETEFTTDNPEFNLTYEVKPDSIANQVEKLAHKVDCEPENARVKEFHPFAENRFTYKDGEDGYRLDKEWLTTEISSFFGNRERELTIDAEYETLEPDISVADLKENIVGLSKATSYSNNTLDGTHNMAVALDACNGSIIEPGGTWSFNDHTGDSNKEELGYRNAQVIVDKKIEEGVGGGICQASTTIFKAAVLANMGIVERHNHYWASAYAYAGEDATIDYPNLDLKLRNNTDYQMFIECKADGRTLIVNIYGYQSPEYDNIRIYSENYEIEKKKSFKSRMYRVLYKDHEIVREETLCTSTYSLTDNHSVRTEDKGTFRTTVNGYTQTEVVEKPTEPTTKPTSATTAPSTAPTEPQTEKTTETEEPTEQATTEEPPTEAPQGE